MELNTIVSEVGTLVDIRDVSVNKELSRDERIAEFVQQIKNPIHCFLGYEMTDQMLVKLLLR